MANKNFPDNQFSVVCGVPQESLQHNKIELMDPTCLQDALVRYHEQFYLYMASDLQRDEYKFTQHNIGSAFKARVNSFLHQENQPIDQMTSKLFNKLMEKQRIYGGKNEVDKYENVTS